MTKQYCRLREGCSESAGEIKARKERPVRSKEARSKGSASSLPRMSFKRSRAAASSPLVDPG